MSPRRTRQLRDALTLAASLGVVAGALTLNRARPGSAPAASGPPDTRSSAPPPLPIGGEPEPLSLDPIEAHAGCHFVDRGFGAYERWHPLSLGKVLVPPARAIRADGGYELLVHFHGAEPVRRLLASKDFDLVIAAVDVGTRSSEYARALNEGGLGSLIAEIDREVIAVTGRAGAHARRVAVSSWSAGSGAVGRIVERDSSRVDALLLLDSLYAPYMPGQSSLVPGQLGAIVKLASAAARGELLFYLTHADIATQGYASTEETATFVLQELGASAMAITSWVDDSANAAPSTGAAEPDDGLRMTRMYDGGSLYVRGYAGTGPGGHCAQLRLLPSIVAEHVLPAFRR